ncbi:hypothetical protein AB4P23_25640, partial [Escherichia coli]
VLNKTGPQSIHILRGVRQQQDEPGRFSICSRQAAVVLYILAKKEAAQSLYIYFEAMPAGTLFVNMKRLRERLLLTTPIRTQNQIIRKAMRELESIGYLDYQEVKKGRDIQFQIFKRSPKLALAKQG